MKNNIMRWASSVGHSVFWLPVLSLVFLVLARSSGFHGVSLWYDEVLTLEFISGDWGESIAAIRWDLVHPPLYYLVLKAWFQIAGSTEFSGRLLNLIFSAGCLPVIFQIGKQQSLRGLNLWLPVAFFIFNPFVAFYSNQLRMYCLLVLLSSLCVLLFFRIMNKTNPHRAELGMLLFFQTAMVYSQYIGVFLILAMFIICLVYYRQHLLKYSMMALATFLLLLPWVLYLIPVYLKKEGLHDNLGWINVPTASSLINLWQSFNGWGPSEGMRQMFMAFVFFLCCFSIIQLRKTSRHYLVENILMVVIPVFVVFAVSQFFPVAIFGPRYFFIVIISYFMVISQALTFVPGRIRGGLIAVVAGWILLSFFQFGPLKDHYFDYKLFAQHVADVGKEEHITEVLVFRRKVSKPLAHYLRSLDPDFEVKQDWEPAPVRKSLLALWKGPEDPKGIVDSITSEGFTVSSLGVYESGGKGVELLLVTPLNRIR